VTGGMTNATAVTGGMPNETAVTDDTTNADDTDKENKILNVKAIAYADDLSVSGPIEDLKCWWTALQECGRVWLLPKCVQKSSYCKS
jgi:hypothetical protein